MEKNKKKVWKYHKSHKFKNKEGKELSFITQIYQVGVYGILNGNSAAQGSYTPNQIVGLEKKLKKLWDKGDITDLEFGTPITVTTDESGFYIEKKD